MMFGHKKGLEQKLSAQGGTGAWATILSAEEKWGSGRGGNTGFGAPSSITLHMKVTLRVEPEGAPAFEATFDQAFPDHMPHAGGKAKVIYDPEDPSKIAVMEGQVSLPGASVERQERSRARREEAMEAFRSGHMAEYLERRKADARGAAVIVDGRPVGMPG